MSAKFTAQALRAPKLVALLGVDARLASNDEPEIDRGPLTQPAELTQAEWAAHVCVQTEEQLDAIRKEGW